ncbi:hypothetical protein [Providencia sp.]|uniref:hypothetical protein n=1 Tax=Providencia sp. TaxID=589 RepID=UPI0033420645
MNLSKGYEVEFNEALARAKQWALDVPPFTPSNQPAITDESIEKFRLTAQKILGQYQPEEVSQQCFQITGLMKETLEEIFNVPLTITIGYVSFNQTPVFYTPTDKLNDLLSQPPHFEGVNLHAWLTTPNHEIIDLTFGTTYSIVKDAPETLGVVICQHHSQFTESMSYHPQLVGEEFLLRIAGIAGYFFVN